MKKKKGSRNERVRKREGKRMKEERKKKTTEEKGMIQNCHQRTVLSLSLTFSIFNSFDTNLRGKGRERESKGTKESIPIQTMCITSSP